MQLAHRFGLVWKGLGCHTSPANALARLIDHYMEPWRTYHTLKHVAHCLSELNTVSRHGWRGNELEIALWYHDVIYETIRDGKPVTDNEERSLELCNTELRTAGIDEGTRSRICELILATKHRGGIQVGSSARMVDIDLAILGQKPHLYVRYAQGIEAEYRYGGRISQQQYLNGRIQLFLKPMLARPQIYNTPEFGDRYEQQAQENIALETATAQYRMSGKL